MRNYRILASLLMLMRIQKQLNINDMKKFVKILFGLVVLMMATSCQTTRPVTATSNPVGNKCGVAETTIVLGFFGGSSDCGINKAAKNGGITRISHIDAYEKNYGVVNKIGVRVYGE